MALGKAEWRRRVAAACALHGLDLRDLEDFDGLPKNAASRAGHPSDTYSPNHTLAMVLAERFELPIGWFEDEHWRPTATGVDVDEALHQILDQQAELLVMVQGVRDELERQRKRPGTGGQTARG